MPNYELDKSTGDLRLGGDGAGGDLELRDLNGDRMFRLDATTGDLHVGGANDREYDGDVAVYDRDGNLVVHLDSTDSAVTLYDETGEMTVKLDGDRGDIYLDGVGWLKDAL